MTVLTGVTWTTVATLLSVAWVVVVLVGLGLVRAGQLSIRPGWRPRVGGLVSHGLEARGLDPQRVRRFGRALAIAVVGAVLVPPVGVGAAIPALVLPELADRRARRGRQHDVVVELPEVVDLFRVGASAGLTVTESARLLADRGRGPVAMGFARAVRKVDRGGRVGDALEEVTAVGEALRPLIRTLVGVERYGLPLEPAITEVAVIARAERRRRIETAARQVSVRLLAPLVVCVLPAFMLLTVVPSLLTSVGRLSP